VPLNLPRRHTLVKDVSRISPGKSAITDPSGHIGVGSGFHSTSAMYVAMWRRQNEAGSLPPRIADRQGLVEPSGASVSSSRSWTYGARGSFIR
jgi:hypothetical protein